MGRREMVDCDACDCEIGLFEGNTSQRLVVAIGSYTDAAGSSEVDRVELYLCGVCAVRELDRMLRHGQADWRKEWVEAVRCRCQARRSERGG